MKKTILLLLLLKSIVLLAQNEIAPIYIGCENEAYENIEKCFFNNLKTNVENNFTLPKTIINNDYKGIARITFNVTKTGKIEIVYINAAHKELKTEIKNVFKNLPTIKPAMYNGRAVDKQYVLPLGIPIGYQPENIKKDTILPVKKLINNNLLTEYNSQLNIPFTHQKYDDIQFHLNTANNSHSTVKPFVYNAVNKLVDFESENKKLYKKTDKWFYKKLWNEHLVHIKGNDYWFTLDPVFDAQLGKDNTDINYTFNNTRAVIINGGLGKKFNFSTSFFESQGRFAKYINKYNDAHNIMIGRGRFKPYKVNAFDYPVAQAYLSYTPNKFFNFQLGHGKNFIGDGYRSLFLSDVTSPYPYFKISTNFWKIKYTNLWMFLDDIRPEALVNGVNLRKYVGIHHLSYNVTKKLNIGLFETVISNNENNNGFDINYFNPLIFYRAVEYNRGSRGGNALVGLNTSYKLTKNIFLYSQFILDELSIAKFKEGNGYWANKYGVQAGVKYYNAFGINNLYLQGETNIVRPFTYSHRKSTLNYGHFNQPLAHLWGSNFYELIGIARYKKERWYGNAKIVFGKKGFDFNESENNSYGGNIYRPYTERVSDYNNDTNQGNKSTLFLGELQVGYLANPTTNLRFFTKLSYRNFDITTITPNLEKDNNIWFTFGVKTDVFNTYFDF